ncbi:cystatin-9-like [Octodon degus]|uniref:Cystatin-9-like n=1 Tax=Octodon degus TaxID=10160 RepID=A0A6P3VBJ2_OCTDE|nr:cystatin-9-like [Octodon degus]
MAHLPRKRPPRACALVLLLWGIQLLGTVAWHIQPEQEYHGEVTIYAPPTMEFAQHMFNQEHEDEYAFRVEHVLNIQREQTDNMVFSMMLQLRRTMCKKLQEDLDNCLFQDSSEPSNVITCTFNVSTLPWTTEFQLLNKNCSAYSP